MSKVEWQDWSWLMDSELEEVRSKEREKTTEAVVAVVSKGRRMWEMRRGHTVPREGESTESNLEDLEASQARFSSMLLSRWARVFSKRFGGEWRGIRGEEVEGGG